MAKKKVVKTNSKPKSCKVSDKLRTGIPGLDDAFKGGILQNCSLLISGGPGTGKTILGMQFLLEGAKKGEPGLFVLYDSNCDVLKYAKSVGLDIDKYIKQGLIHVLEQSIVVKKTYSLASPAELIRKHKVKRVFLDSLTMFTYVHLFEDKDYRKEIARMLEGMKGVTLLASAERSGTNVNDITFKPEDFMFDGVVFMTKVRQEATFERVMYIGKMRGQEHLLNLFPFSIGKGGIKAYPDQIPFSLMTQETAFKTKEE